MKIITLFPAIALMYTSSVISQNVGIGVLNPTNKLEVASSVTPSNSATISGLNNGSIGSAIVGNSSNTNTIAVQGYSANGFGVQGYTNNNIAIGALANTGIALNASSFSGYALNISGNMKFSGGNMNPSAGALLTSNADGDATWKKSSVAFLGSKSVANAFSQGVYYKVEFPDESYDLKNNFENYNGNVTSNSSCFIAPFAGTYHFLATGAFFKTGSGVPNYYFNRGQIRIMKNGITQAYYIGHPFLTYTASSSVYLQISGDFHLEAGDKIWIEAAQYNSNNTTENFNNARFSGFLVAAD